MNCFYMLGVLLFAYESEIEVSANEQYVPNELTMLCALRERLVKNFYQNYLHIKAIISKSANIFLATKRCEKMLKMSIKQISKFIRRT